MTDQQAIHDFCERINLVLLLDHGGRAGSNFFQCLFDNHRQVLACPLVHYVYSYWGRFFSGRASVTKAEAHDFIAKHSYFRFLYQDPIGECGDTIIKIGGDIDAPFDRGRYRALIDEIFAGDGDILRRDVILHGYVAYALVRGFDLSCIRYVMLNDAVSQRGEDMLRGFSGNLIDQARADFPEMITLALLRDPRAQYASTKHQMVNELGNNYNLHRGTVWHMFCQLWRDQISLDEGPAHLCLLYQVSAYRDLLRKWQEHSKNWLFLRNEDFNTAFVPTMRALCAALQVDPDPEWISCGDDYKARMMGRPWAGTGAYSSRYQTVTNGPLDNGPQQVVAVGPSLYVTERWKERLPRHEQALLEIYFAYEISYCGYDFFIPAAEKSGWRKFLSGWRSWAGEIPRRDWIKKARTIQDRRERQLYFFWVWGLYILARFKLGIYQRRGFFTRGLRDIQALPQFVGQQVRPVRTDPITREESCYAADIVSPSLMLATLGRCLRGHPVRIILAQTSTHSRMQRFLSLWADVRQCPQDLGDFRNAQGLHLFCDRENILLSIYNAYLRQCGDLQWKNLARVPDYDIWRSYFSRYIVDQFGMRIAAQLLVAHHVLNSDVPFTGVYLTSTPEDDFFSNLLAVRVAPKFTLSLDFIIKDVKHLMRLFFYLTKSLVLPLQQSKPSERSKLCVQHVSGIQGCAYPGDLDWLSDSKIDSQKIVYLVEGADVLDNVTHSFCRDQRIGIAYGSQYKPDWAVISVRDALIRAAYVVLSALCQGRLKFAAAYSYYTVFFHYWQQFFHDKGIACFVNVADTNLDALPKTHALESLGGVDLSFEFSATGYHAFMDSRPLGHQQYICWGPLTQAMIQACAQAVPYRFLPNKIFQAGNMRTYMKSRFPAEAKIVLDKIEKSEAHRKILVMDSTSTHLKFLSVQSVHDFYDAVFKLITQNPSDLFILKPQRPLNLRDDQMAFLSVLESKGRLIIAPWHGLPHYLFPKVDLVVGTPIYASSLMEAQSFNLPVLCFDNSGWPHRVRDILPEFCLADDGDSFVAKAAYLLSGCLSDSEYVALENLRKQIDPYGDGNGHLRFADLIRLWMDALSSEGSANKALPKVIQSYERLWPLSIPDKNGVVL